jgi:hypothetical protein
LTSDENLQGVTLVRLPELNSRVVGSSSEKGKKYSPPFGYTYGLSCRLNRYEDGIDLRQNIRIVKCEDPATVAGIVIMENPEVPNWLVSAQALDPVARIDRADKFFASMAATIKNGGNRAYYAQELDYIQMPPIEAFRDAESYYATLAHELTHWTKHPQRLGRDFGRKSWGDEGYSREELVAELGSAFLCADLELHQEPREENAAYVASWLEVLKNDTRAIFTAAAHAQRAADYLNQKAAAQVPEACAA